MTSTQQLTEFDIISRYFSAIGPESVFSADSSVKNPVSPVVVGIGDDCALLSVPVGQVLALSIDTMVAGRHFPIDADGYDVGQRLLAVAISDLAAMGATPLAFTLAITLPAVDNNWLEKFSQGLQSAAQYYQIPLIGGDTTQGPLTLSVQVHGTVPANQALTRAGAQVGDAIFVTGSLGDGAAALAVLENSLEVNSEQRDYLISRFYRPRARVAVGQRLLGIATAAIDISDGLLADLGHIARASAVAATIDISRLPVSTVVKTVASQQSLNYALAGGDDYELCFTASGGQRQQLHDIAQTCNVAITEIGVITVGTGVNCVDAEGAAVHGLSSGYEHFKTV